MTERLAPVAVTAPKAATGNAAKGCDQVKIVGSCCRVDLQIFSSDGDGKDGAGVLRLKAKVCLGDGPSDGGPTEIVRFASDRLVIALIGFEPQR